MNFCSFIRTGLLFISYVCANPYSRKAFQINPTSQWLKRIRSLIEIQVTMYPSQATAMGFSDENLPELTKIEQFL